MKNIKLIAIDLDGTLVRSDQTISEHTIDTIIDAQRRGTMVAIVSGRPTYGATPVADALRLADYGGYLVSYNGAEIYECRTGSMLFSDTLDDAVIPVIYSTAKENGLAVMTYIGKEVVTEQANAGNEYIRYSSMRNKMQVRPVSDFLLAASQPIVKCIIVGEPNKLIQMGPSLNSALAGRADAYRSEPFFLEVVPHGIDKAQGLAHLLDATGMRPGDIMAIGDGYNDIPMLSYAGCGVAMGNARDAVKEKADYVTLGNDEDGVAAAIERFVL